MCLWTEMCVVAVGTCLPQNQCLKEVRFYKAVELRQDHILL
jgi:hypothetical protein